MNFQTMSGGGAVTVRCRCIHGKSFAAVAPRGESAIFCYEPGINGEVSVHETDTFSLSQDCCAFFDLPAAELGSVCLRLSPDKKPLLQ